MGSVNRSASGRAYCSVKNASVICVAASVVTEALISSRSTNFVSHRPAMNGDESAPVRGTPPWCKSLRSAILATPDAWFRSLRRGSADGRSICRSSSRNTPAPCSRCKRANRIARPNRRVRRSFDLARVGLEILFRVFRVDPAFDRRADARDSGPGFATAFAPAIRICSLIKSTPVTISVTGCSTWIRALTSMK
jgi:hypothetical protein